MTVSGLITVHIVKPGAGHPQMYCGVRPREGQPTMGLSEAAWRASALPPSDEAEMCRPCVERVPAGGAR